MAKTWALILGIILIILAGFILYFNNTGNPDEPKIGEDNDEQGCLISAGYSYNESLNVCIREFDLDANDRKAVKIALENTEGNNLTIENVDKEPCEGCFIVEIKKQDNQIKVWIENFTFFELKEYHYCQEDEINADACIEVYDPVCGNNKQTYSNGCFACMSNEIDYYIKGEC